jgi:hypothetical protein
LVFKKWIDALAIRFCSLFYYRDIHRSPTCPKTTTIFDAAIENLKSHLAHFTPRGDQDRDYVEVVKELLALYENERDRVAQHIQEGE